MSHGTRIFLLISVILAIVVIGSLLLLNQQRTNTTPPAPDIAPIPIESPFPDASEEIFTPYRPGGGAENAQFQADEKEYLEKTPLLQKLPYDQQYFSVEYLSETHLIIHARTSDKARDYQAAKNWFIENGIDTSTIKMDYQ